MMSETRLRFERADSRRASAARWRTRNLVMPAAFAKLLRAKDENIVEIRDSDDRVQLRRNVLQYLPRVGDAR